jgi:hypothetical protein
MHLTPLQSVPSLLPYPDLPGVCSYREILSNRNSFIDRVYRYREPHNYYLCIFIRFMGIQTEHSMRNSVIHAGRRMVGKELFDALLRKLLVWQNYYGREIRYLMFALFVVLVLLVLSKTRFRRWTLRASRNSEANLDQGRPSRSSRRVRSRRGRVINSSGVENQSRITRPTRADPDF